MIESLRAQFELAIPTIAVGICCNVACAILGCFLVLRRMSLLGDAISHSILPGIALAFLLTGSRASLPMFVGAVAVGILTAVLTQSLHTIGKVPEDASMGVVFTALFALGVVLITRTARQVDLDPGCVLYGMIETAPFDTVPVAGLEVPRTLITMGCALVVTIGFVTLAWKELKIVSFDPALATAIGIPALVVHYALMGMVAGVTVSAFEAVGSILVIAMLIVPAATAQLMSDRLGWMMAWSIAVGVVSAVVGYWGAAQWNTSVAGMMGVVAGGCFSFAFVFSPRHGLVCKIIRNLRLSLRIAGEDIIALIYRAEEKADPSTIRVPVPTRSCVKIGGGGMLARFALLTLWWRGMLQFAGASQVELTQSGRRSGRSLVRSHRLWEAYLDQHFDLPLDHLHEPASRLEHFTGPRLQIQLEEGLRGPSSDPHGQPIPPAASRDE